VSGEPLAYVLGTAEFRHLTLTTDRRALIPRPETEGLIDLVLARQRSGRVLDVGTGTGCIALSLAQEGAFELVVAVERSPDALALARMNVAQTGLPVHLVLGNFCRMFESGAFDVLVSNPPYLSDLEYTNLEPGVRNWEPEGALRAGRTGMDAVHQVLREGRDVVKARGWIILEIDSVRGELSAEAAGGAGWCEVTVLDDLFGRARYLLARRSE
jgi:release factor glutamine methyltransferase